MSLADLLEVTPERKAELESLAESQGEVADNPYLHAWQHVKEERAEKPETYTFPEELYLAVKAVEYQKAEADNNPSRSAYKMARRLTEEFLNNYKGAGTPPDVFSGITALKENICEELRRNYNLIKTISKLPPFKWLKLLFGSYEQQPKYNS